MHEAGHAALDQRTYDTAAWNDAVLQDNGRFASEYAMDFPNREDVTESYLAWFAVRYRSDRISHALKNWIERTIPRAAGVLRYAVGGRRRRLCGRHVPGRGGRLPHRHGPELIGLWLEGNSDHGKRLAMWWTRTIAS